MELEKDSIYNKYIDKVGTIINAEVYQIWKKEMLLLDDEGNELLLPKTEQIPSDFYRKGETARAVVARVDNKNNNPKIILSRTSPVFLQRLFEMEVPEINDGLITIKKIARIPGERAKIAVESYDDRIDGGCLCRCKRQPYSWYCPRASQREYRCYQLYIEYSVVYTASP